jgi:membrane protease YdiL (CAAX protease family)
VFCAIVLILFTSLLDAFMRASRKQLPGFSDFSRTLPGRLAYIAALDGLLLATVVGFSRTVSPRDFLVKIGLHRQPTLAGWSAGWVALGLAVLDHYGASRGWTASARIPTERDGYSAESLLFLITTGVFIGPLVEEIVTRGYLYRALRASFTLIPSVGLVICFSAFFHAGSISLSAFTAACLISLWVALCVVRERSESLWNCMFCHGIYNAAAVRQWALCAAGMILCLLLCHRQVFQLFGAGTAEDGGHES